MVISINKDMKNLGYLYVIRKAKLNEIEKLINIATKFDGFLISSNILLESKIDEFRRVAEFTKNVNKPIIADLKLGYSEKEEIVSTLQTLHKNGFSGTTIFGLLDNEVINIYTEFSEDFNIYAYLGKTDTYSIIDKIIELEETKCHGIILSFGFILELDEIKKKSKWKKQLYICMDGDENIIIPI